MEQVYDAIAFYLSRNTEVDANIQQGEEELRRSVQPLNRRKADNDLNQIIVAATFRREPAIDFQTADQARLDHLDDPAVLPPAASGVGSWSLTTNGQCRSTWLDY